MCITVSLFVSAQVYLMYINCIPVYLNSECEGCVRRDQEDAGTVRGR